MARNLDITTLRSFVAVADYGGVTRAAGFLHLTQSAVSMQLKRLEELLGLALLDRSGRTIALTPSGEQLLGYARRMVALNDEVIGRLTDQAYEGEVVLGVPHDVVYPVIPQVLQRFNASFPRVNVNLVTSNTRDLKAGFAKGTYDLILTTESGASEGGETIHEMPLRWVGAPNGSAWRQKPLRLGFCRACIFRPVATAKLDEAGVEWDMAVDSESDRTVEATISADLAVGVLLEGTIPAHQEAIDHGGLLPELPIQHINLYGAASVRASYVGDLARVIRQGYAALRPVQLRSAG
ncbi:LysR family transcriptional regulator [Pseudophaeobacter sp.]|jgi:DNA-binding transcriptional LysR family regulator|uniref:LysR family transcriptional regulator n=1 Tax=Pseudophaeobacter sp. TaxID=1971739 RepID=UPI002202780F|nr:LysR family transcriptional regulator [Pseudophaeobacter sp.]UWS78604.1 LysR family transcriptional regulator [Phaeobacter sp. G2]